MHLAPRISINFERAKSITFPVIALRRFRIAHIRQMVVLGSLAAKAADAGAMQKRGMQPPARRRMPLSMTSASLAEIRKAPTPFAS